MILYFADPDLNILGNASTDLSATYIIADDKKVEDIDAGVSTLEGRIFFDEGNRLKIEKLVAAGNVIFRYEESESEPLDTAKDSDQDEPEEPKNRYTIKGFKDVFTIIETEIDTKAQTIYFYAEDGALSLLNKIVGAYSNTNKFIGTYINAALVDTGFTLKNAIADIDNFQLSLEWTENQTVIARLQDIASYFGFEFSFGFDIQGMTISSKWVKFEKERGRDTNLTVAIDRRVENILVKKSIANLATGLLPIGKDDLTLDGYTWSDGTGDFHTSGLYLVSDKAKDQWCGNTGHIYRTFECNAETQVELKDKALAELKKRIQPEINYDVDVVEIPPGVGLGDRINVVDDNANLYISGRILRMETSVTQVSRHITLGEWKIKSAGISARVKELASAFKVLAAKDSFYTWIAYATDAQGSNISLSPLNRSFIGVAVNQTSPDVDLTNPSIFSWVEIDSSGILAVSINITSSNGAVFIDDYIDTALTAHVFLNGKELTEESIASIGEIRWYDADDMTTVLGTGLIFTIDASSQLTATNITAQLERNEA